VLTVYPAESWAPRVRAREFYPRDAMRRVGICNSNSDVSICLSSPERAIYETNLRFFRPISRRISEAVQDRTMVTIEH